MVDKIAFIGQPEYFRFSYENDLDDVAQVMEFPFHFGMGEEAFSALEEYDATYNFFFRGEFFPEKVLSRLRGIKINLSSEPFPRHIDNQLEYTRDSLTRYLDFRLIREKAFDYIFHYDEASLPFMASDGLNLSGAFPFPVATNTYSPKSVVKNLDLFFVGRSSIHREKYFGALKHLYHFLHIAHGVWGPPLIDYISKAKICLNIHAEDEISWEPRMQMLLAAGAFIVSEKITPNPILRPNIDFIEIGSPQELHDSVAYYLAHPSEREKIAESGCQRVREQLDAKSVFKRLLQEITMGDIAKFTVGRERKFLNFLQQFTMQARQIKNFLK